MKWILTALIVLTLAFSCSPDAGANNYSNGYSEHGYTWRDGYWWYNGQAYTRSYVQGQGYYSCGYYYPGRAYYQYTPYYAQAPAASLSHKDPDWKTKIVDLAQTEVKIRGQLLKDQQDYAQFQNALKSLGLEGKLGNGLPSYNAPPGLYGNGYGAYGQGQSLQLSTAGVNGSTVFGYTQNKIADFYGDTNTAANYQALNRLAQQLIEGGTSTTQDFGALVTQDNAQRAEIAKVLAQGQVARELMQAVREGARLETKSFAFQQKSGGGIEQVPPQGGTGGGLGAGSTATPQQVRALWTQSAGRCAACHLGSRKEGGFDVSNFPGMNPVAQLKVIQRITMDENDPKFMPRVQSGGPGQRVPAQEVQLWLATVNTGSSSGPAPVK